jgi:hypothetical protein
MKIGTNLALLTTGVALFGGGYWLNSHLSKDVAFDVRNFPMRVDEGRSLPWVLVHTKAFEMRYKESLFLVKKGEFLYLDDEPLSPDSWSPEITEVLKARKARFLVLVIPSKDRFQSFISLVDKARELPVEGIVIESADEPNQLPVPTSPSVTPPACAGGTPSVAADH